MLNAAGFIKGFRELRSKMPKISVTGYQNQNCPYGNGIYNSKNCYVCFECEDSEESLYGAMISRCKFCVDCLDVWNSELCYEGIELYHCYNCDFSQFLRDCSDCSYSYDLLNCHNCFGCVGLRRAEYHIFNKKYSPQEYKEEVARLRTLPRAEIEKKIEPLRLAHPHLYSRQYQTENCFGDNIQNAKNCFYCFNTKQVYDGMYLHDVYNVYGERNEDVGDSFFSVDMFNSYECVQVGDGYNCNFCYYCEHIKDAEFCESSFNSRNLFGCSFLNRKEYYILNQPYEKEAWHKETGRLRDELKKRGQYGWAIF